MISLIWAIMLILGFLACIWNGNIDAVTTGALDGAAEGVRLCITLLGAYGLWMGIMGIAQRSGMLDGLSRSLARILQPLFKLPAKSDAWPSITLNLAANMLGLGNAATPAGIRAMESLQIHNPNPAQPTNTMVLFLALNASSIQLLPTTVIALRAAAGSSAPADIVLPTLLATTISTLTAILSCKWLERRWDRWTR